VHQTRLAERPVLATGTAPALVGAGQVGLKRSLSLAARKPETRRPKPEIPTWRSQNQIEEKETAEYAEYAESPQKEVFFCVFRVFRGSKIEAILDAI
jgi:hypothetical protein